MRRILNVEVLESGEFGIQFFVLISISVKVESIDLI